jgi:hypothetical protein
VSAGFIAVNAANRMPTDNKEKEPRVFNHPFPSVTRGHSTQGHNKEHRANLTCFKDQLIARNFSGVSSVLSVSSSAAGGKKKIMSGAAQVTNICQSDLYISLRGVSMVRKAPHSCVML